MVAFQLSRLAAVSDSRYPIQRDKIAARLEYAIDLFLHLDVHLAEFVAQYGVWVYAMLFAIIFIETGLVIWPFLPGDSLLFAAGALAATGVLDIYLVGVLLIAAAVAGASFVPMIAKSFTTTPRAC